MSTSTFIGSVALAEIGTEVWERQPEESDYEPRGGVVVATESVVIDEEEGGTGRAFLVIDPFRTRPTITFHRLQESDINPDRVTAAETSRLANIVRRLCEEVAFSGRGKPRKGLLTSDQAEWVSYAHRLTAVLMGGR